MNQELQKPQTPRMSPYVFTILLFGFGIWCIKDGWFNSDPDYEHALFNQVVGVILLVWSVYDYFKLTKNKKKDKESED